MKLYFNREAPSAICADLPGGPASAQRYAQHMTIRILQIARVSYKNNSAMSCLDIILYSTTGNDMEQRHNYLTKEKTKTNYNKQRE